MHHTTTSAPRHAQHNRSRARSVRLVCRLNKRKAAGDQQVPPASAALLAPACTARPVSVLHRIGRGLTPTQAAKGVASVEQDASTSAAMSANDYNCEIRTEEGGQSSLEVQLVFVGKDQRPVGDLVDLSKFKQTPWKVKDASGNLVDRGVKYQGSINVPSDAVADLLMLRLKPDAKVDKEYINEITITPDKDGDGSVISIAPNSWIHKAQGARFFFASGLAHLPSQTPPELAAWRAAELDDIKGTLTQRMGMRDDWDRIYDYDVYNDLAESGVSRAILGGSEHPYPRRIRTGRPLIRAPNGKLTYEARKNSDGTQYPFWVPLDERFNTIKQTNFTTYQLLAAVPTAVVALQKTLFKSGRKLESFNDVNNLYAEMRKPSVTITLDGFKDALKLLKIKPDTVITLPFVGQLQAGAVDSSVDNVNKLVGGLQNLAEFPRPLVVSKERNNDDIWKLDEEWGRQALAGVNPSCIEALTTKNSVDKLGAITEAHLKRTLQGHSLKDLLAAGDTQPRLLFIDHTAVFADYAPKISGMKGRYGYSGRAVLFQRDDEQWVPAAIELTGSEGATTVYTPADHYNVWLLAKGVFTSIDAGFHQLITHWLRCHACTEPYIIATHRCLSSLHPVFKLMVPHWRFTPMINANARQNLIPANGIIEGGFTPGQYAMEMSSAVYGALWRFDQQGLPADLIHRGLAKKGADGKVQLLLKDYPYADDGMLIWDALHDWVGKYLRCYYNDSVPAKSVAGDVEINKWWKEIQTEGHPDKKEGWPTLKTINDLTEILTTMIWVASAHHAAINFSQYAYNGHMLNRPSICTKAIPQKDDPEYQTLVKDRVAGEKAYIDTLSDNDNDILNTLKAIVTVELLSTHADNEVYLGDPNHPYILDEVPRKLFVEFTERVKDIEATINARNKDGKYRLRNGTAVSLAYELMAPTSKPGVTNRGVPQSVSI